MALYLRGETVDAVRERVIAAALPGKLELRSVEGVPWTEVRLSEPDMSPELLKELSRGGEVVFCAIQTTASVLDLRHVKDGVILRTLSHADGEGWLESAG